MNKYIWFYIAFALTLLISCVPSTVTPSPDLAAQAQEAEWEAEKAQREAEALHTALTATANAPILLITQQAAALELEQKRAGITSTAYQAAIELEQKRARETATAYQATLEASWTPTPNATSTYVMAVAAAQQTQIASDSARNLLELERQRNANIFKAVMPGLTFAFLSVIAIWVVIIITRRERMRVVQRDARGDAPLLLDVVDGIVTDPDASPNFQSGTRPQKPEENPLPQLPAVTAKRQDKVKQNDQLLDLATRGLPAPNVKSGERRQLAAEQAMRQLPDGTSRFRVLGPGERPPASVIDEETIEILDAQWKEVEDDES